MKQSRNLWPLGIFAAFGLFISGMATLIVVACSNPSSLVSRDYYEQEIQYQEQIDRFARTSALASRPTANFDPTRRAILLSLPSEHVTDGTSGSVQLYRPSTANLDRHEELRLDEQGRQLIDATGLAPGLWKVKVKWTVAGADYGMEQDLFIPDRNS